MYVSIDTETLGLDPNRCDLIEFGAVIETGEELADLPTFHCYVTKPSGIYHGEPMAMAMHHLILTRMAKRTEGYSYIPADCLDMCFHEWLEEKYPNYDVDEKKKITVAGKNFANFDMRFLRRIGFGVKTRLHHRMLDPASMFYDPMKDETLPGLEECMRRAGVDKLVAHTAVEDALDVIRCIRNA